MPRLLCLSLLFPLSLQADDIPYGVEAVTGLRSSYIYRGFKLADTTLDFQLQSEVTLAKDNYLSFGAWHAAESDGNFSTTELFLDLNRDLDDLTIGATLSYHNFNHSFFQSGLDFGIYANLLISDDWAWRTALNYDFGADGFYMNTELNWSHPVSDDAFVSILGGASAVSDNYGRDGLNDLYLRIALTYGISERVSLTPFVGGSFVIDDDTAFSDDEAYAGFWFEVTF